MSDGGELGHFRSFMRLIHCIRVAVSPPYLTHIAQSCSVVVVASVLCQVTSVAMGYYAVV